MVAVALLRLQGLGLERQHLEAQPVAKRAAGAVRPEEGLRVRFLFVFVWGVWVYMDGRSG